ncbi:MAG: two-component system, NtrC family, nitrogen regulation sensor histidine kinase GlnL [Gammaproteobacteria bacterium]|nr:two-component system, NtrC family, nitrogen regulation sensor histidine kinase GlnL [Gammaproteobacteria bacterium]
MSAEFKIETLHIDGSELLDAMVTSVFLLDENLHVTYLNAAAQTLLGLGPNQALGKSIAELTRGAESLLPMFERARTDGEGVVQRELAWPAPGGVDRTLDCAVTQIVIGQQHQRLLLEIEDITQHRRLTRENALLAQLGGSRLMVRQLAHEIKNPLGGLRGAAQLLERELLDPALREYTRVIISEADRLTNLLDSLLGPGRPPAKQLINVHELLERVYHLLRSEAPQGVTIDRDYDPSLPPLTVDPNHIIQAMLNLGRNAIQALAGSAVASPRLILRTRAANNASVGAHRHRLVASIQFEDNGPGVLNEIRETIFYPLVSGRADGTGLGLGIAQDLVSRHGGLIEFDSSPGRTIFVISLPMNSA